MASTIAFYFFMILILSSSSDANIDYLINWLLRTKKKYFRLNCDDLIEKSCFMNIERDQLIIGESLLEFGSIETVFFSKFFGFSKTQYFHKANHRMSSKDIEQISREFFTLQNFIISRLDDKKWNLKPKHATMNKLVNIRLAAEVGLTVPETYVLSSTSQLDQILKDNKQLITKSLYEPYFIRNDHGYYSMFTQEIDAVILSKTFFPSLAQEKIEKEYEIRSFFYKGDFFSMAIFSQKAEMSKLDFRKFNWLSPNRNVPYKLNDDMKIKLKKLFKKLNLDYCSVDLIKSVNGSIYFLEINPTGQYGMINFPCNYEIYKTIVNSF